MELKILHFYPDLMSLYGSYANVSILKRTLEEMGNTVAVERVAPRRETPTLTACRLSSTWAPVRSGRRRPLSCIFPSWETAVKAAAESRRDHAVCRKLHGASGQVHHR